MANEQKTIELNARLEEVIKIMAMYEPNILPETKYLDGKSYAKMHSYCVQRASELQKEIASNE